METTLNTDCWLKIMRYLSVPDLLQLSEGNKPLKNLIAKDAVGKKFLNLRHMEPDLKNEIFTTFGMFLRKIAFLEKQLEPILLRIITNCAVNRLDELHMQWNAAKDNVMSAINYVLPAMPYFVNIYTVDLDVVQFDRSVLPGSIHIVNSIYCNTSTHITPRTFNNRRTMGTFNVTDLKIIKPRSVSVSALDSFVSTLSHLKNFSYDGHTYITAVVSTLAGHWRTLANRQKFMPCARGAILRRGQQLVLFGRRACQNGIISH